MMPQPDERPDRLIRSYFDFIDFCLTKALWLNSLALIALATLLAVPVLRAGPIEWSPVCESQAAITVTIESSSPCQPELQIVEV